MREVNGAPIVPPGGKDGEENPEGGLSSRHFRNIKKESESAFGTEILCLLLCFFLPDKSALSTVKVSFI